jgi:hypothetical protein
MPYAQVFGIGGVAWEQNGIHYTPRGEPVSVKTEFIRGETRDEDTTRYTVSALPVDAVSAPANDPLISKHWRELKALLEAQGHEWPGTKEDAVKLLRGGHVQRHVEAADGPLLGQDMALEMLGLAR